LGKSLALYLGLVLAVSVLFSVAVPASAQTVPHPSVPEFTVKFVNASYTVSTTNIYTGVTEEELVSNDSIVITITNQPFSYSGYQLYYNVRCKPHFGGEWVESHPVENLTIGYEGGDFSYAPFIVNAFQQSNSAYTTLNYSVEPTVYTSLSGYDILLYEDLMGFYGIPYGSQLDFQVEAQVGHPSSRWVAYHILYPMDGGYDEPATAFDTSSGWSDSKTTVIGESIASAQPTPSVPEFPTLIILPLFIVLPVILAIIYRKNSPLKRIR
jgi:hypothetical protein